MATPESEVARNVRKNRTKSEAGQKLGPQKPKENRFIYVVLKFWTHTAKVMATPKKGRFGLIYMIIDLQFTYPVAVGGTLECTFFESPIGTLHGWIGE